MKEARDRADDRGGKTNQAMFSIDFETWQQLIEAMEIAEGLLPHREQDESSTQVNARGWYG